MRTYSPTLKARIARKEVVARNYLWIGARRRSDGQLVERGFWSDLGETVADVVRPDGAVVSRTYANGIGLVSVETVPLVVGLTARPVTVEMAPTEQAVLDVVNGFTIKLAPFEIHLGFFNPNTMRLDEPATLECMGTVTEVNIVTAEAGGISRLTLTCSPHPQELLRGSERMRSDADQRRRDPNDSGLRHVGKPKRQLEWIEE